MTLGLAKPIAELVRDRKVIVLCGPGGVGKTTTSAALALAAAHLGRRVLVLTIDPARRLADALGLPLSAPHPLPVPADRLRSLGLDGQGSLDAWMLDPRVVFERVVRRLGTPAQADKIVGTRLFQHMSELASGMLEYTAGEALYTFTTEGRYDLVVLDTPPSRNALDFLDAPARLSAFLEDSVLRIFLPKEGSSFLSRAGRLVGSVFSRVFGEGFVQDLEVFFGAFGGLFGGMRQHSDGVAKVLASADSAFVLVTSAEEDAVREAMFFRSSLEKRKLPFAGFILNRSLARAIDWAHPANVPMAESAPEAARSALEKLAPFADAERAEAEAHAKLVRDLSLVAGDQGFAVAAPLLLEPKDDLVALVDLARGMTT
jgi:anion-transporting  ArsA/GET3 family ATPase